MAGGNLSPRQKMINMMYLVLTALLALNVSKEILEAFVTVNNGLETTKSTFSEKMASQYNAFANSYNENKEKVGPYWQSAQQAQSMSDEISAYIDQIKAQVISKAEGLPMEKVIGKNEVGLDTILNLRHISKKDDRDVITNLLIGDSPHKPREGEFTASDLRGKMEGFREMLKGLVADKNPSLTASLDKTFEFGERKDASGTMNNWESANFYDVPLVAGITILSKMQTDVKNAESDVVNWLYSQVDAASYKFTALTDAVIPVSNYVTVGDSFRADVFLAAYDATNFPTIELAIDGGTLDTVNNTIVGNKITVPIGTDGKGKLRLPARAVGEKDWKGLIKFRGPTGDVFQPFSVKYEVAQPNLVVSPTAMNVFYRGVDNPVAISVPGFSADKISPSVTNATLSKASSGYIIRPGSDSKAIVSVSVEMPDGKRKSMPGVEFRVKNVPPPTPYFAGKSVGDNSAKKSELTAAQGVIAKMEDFEFDLKFNVVEFRLTMIVGGTPIEKYSKSAYLTDDMKEIMQKAKPGQKVYIEGIKAKGPDGTIRSLGSLALKVI